MCQGMECGLCRAHTALQDACDGGRRNPGVLDIDVRFCAPGGEGRLRRGTSGTRKAGKARKGCPFRAFRVVPLFRVPDLPRVPASHMS